MLNKVCYNYENKTKKSTQTQTLRLQMDISYER